MHRQDIRLILIIVIVIIHSSMISTGIVIITHITIAYCYYHEPYYHYDCPMMTCLVNIITTSRAIIICYY